MNPNFKKENVKVKNEPGKKHVITGLTRVAHGQGVKTENSKSSMVLDKLKKQKEEQEANKKLEQAEDEIRRLKDELEKSKKMSLKEKAKGIAREQQEREEKAKQDKLDRKSLEKETAEQKAKRKLEKKERKRREKEEADRLDRQAEQEKLNREKVNMAKNKMLGDDRSKKIHNTMGEIRYGDKKKVQETPKNLVSPDLEKMFREELLQCVCKFWSGVEIWSFLRFWTEIFKKSGFFRINVYMNNVPVQCTCIHCELYIIQCTCTM